jgi:hypothetical protein
MRCGGMAHVTLDLIGRIREACACCRPNNAEIFDAANSRKDHFYTSLALFHGRGGILEEDIENTNNFAFDAPFSLLGTEFHRL